MIKTNTLFILGAGASKPFGLPLGKELVDIINKSLIYQPAFREVRQKDYNYGSPTRKFDIDDDTKSANKLFQFLLNLNYSKDNIEQFNQDLRLSQLNSVDAFLEHRTEYIALGKAVIAYNLIKYEQSESMYNNPDWYRYLWNRMNSSFEEFDSNQVSFVTFNYDRSLEFYLMNSLTSTFGKTIEECIPVLNKIPIVHLHGKLGNLPWEAETNVLDYGQSINTHLELNKISQLIKIVHEDITKDIEFKEAHNLMAKAKKIVILGYGYSPTNNERLNFENLQIVIRGSGYGLTQLEKKSIMRRSPKIHIPSDNFDCLGILRNLVEIQ